MDTTRIDATGSGSAISIHDAKSTLSQLIQRAKAGETVLIGSRGRAEVMLVAVGPQRELGAMKGMLTVPAEFNDPLPDNLHMKAGRAS